MYFSTGKYCWAYNVIGLHVLVTFRKCALMAIDDASKFLTNGGEVAVRTGYYEGHVGVTGFRGQDYRYCLEVHVHIIGDDAVIFL